ncbi:hypothetical protein IPF37_06765 [bacterium]|nr:MAG: hypothetical protein IPF37_06765 [bacterium]
MLLSLLGKPLESISEGAQGTVGGVFKSIYTMILGALILKALVAIAIVAALGGVIYWIFKGNNNHKRKK